LTRLRKRLALRDERGFTLIELVVAMPIMLIVMGGLVVMLTTISNKSSQQQEVTTLQVEARNALNIMDNEVRGAFTGDGSSAITFAGPTQLTFYSPDQYQTVAATGNSFHLRQISYQVTTAGLLQRQSMTTTNTFPTASCLTCGGTSQWAWGAMSPWITVVGLSGKVINANNACVPASPTAVPGVFCYYDGSDVTNTINNPQSGTGWSGTGGTYPWKPQTFTGSPSQVAAPAGILTVIITLELSSGGSQPVKFVVSDMVTIRGTS